MKNSLENLVSISSEIRKTHPRLASHLQRSVIRMAANPDTYKFEDRMRGLIVILKSMKQDIERAVKESTDDDFEEFKKFFSDGFEAEQEQIKQILHGMKSAKISSTAGPSDFFKNLFKKKRKPVEDAVSDTSYSMSDYDMDSFVDGRTEWGDSSEYVEKEYGENHKFFTRVRNFMNRIDELRKNPSVDLAKGALTIVKSLISEAEDLSKGERGSLNKKPLPNGPVLEDDPEEGSGVKPTKGPKIDLENVVNHYADMLLENASNEQKSLSLLKELFSKVGPMLEEDRASLASARLASALIRVAGASPRTRKVVLPIIRKIASL